MLLSHKQVILCALICFSGVFYSVANYATQPHPETNAMTTAIPVQSDDENEINRVIAELFKAISFAEDEPPSMRDIKPLFVVNGLLTNYNEEEPLTLPVPDFIQHFEDLVASGSIPSLEDREVSQRTEIYDRIAHRTSYYEARFRPGNEKPFAVGVNSIQLIKTSEGWRIVSMTWNDDSRGVGFFNEFKRQTLQR